MRVLLTGSAGFIGSVVTAQLVAAGHEVTVLDHLSTGFADAAPAGVTLVKGTLRDCAAEVLSNDAPSPAYLAVPHFAAKSLVGESVADPAKYWSAHSAALCQVAQPCSRGKTDDGGPRGWNSPGGGQQGCPPWPVRRCARRGVAGARAGQPDGRAH